MSVEVAWWISVLIGSCSALSVKAGDKLVEHFFEQRQRSNDQRDADVEAVKAVTFEVRELAKSYWLTSGRQHSEEGAITGRMLFIGATVDELFAKREGALRTVHVQMNRFDRACTEGQFGTNDRKAEPNRSAIIEGSAYGLIHSVQREARRL